MRFINMFLLILFLISLSAFGQTDIAGSMDHPMIHRYPGSIIVFYNEVETGTYNYTLGPLVRTSGDSVTLTDIKNIEGKITRIQYMITDDEGFSKVVNYYETILIEDEFEITAFTKSNKPMNVAGRNWTTAVFNDLSYKERSKIAGNKSGEENRYYIAGHVTKQDRRIYLAMIINEFAKREVYVHVDIIDPIKKPGSIEKQEIVTAETIAKNIEQNGYSVIYGIYFDPGGIDIKPDSKPALDEIAKYIKDNNGVAFYVVGHTAMDENLDFQIALSRRRADEVVKILTSRYFINSERLIPQGVGPLAPITTNQHNEGKEMNQRIEIVLKNY